MTKKQISIKTRSSLPTAKILSASRRVSRMKRRVSTHESHPSPATPADRGVLVSISISPTAIRYAGWLVAVMLILAVCWFAPDAAVLAAKVKAICEALKMLK
jgi:hypothetical protein